MHCDGSKRTRTRYKAICMKGNCKEHRGARRPSHRRPRRLRVVSVPPRQWWMCWGWPSREPRHTISGSGSIAGCTTASRMALRGGCAWIHTSTPTSSQGRRRGRPRSQDDVMVAPYEFYPWPRPAHGMSRVLVKVCNARGQLPQGASGEIGWRQAGRGQSNFQKRGEICLA
jgi:hypothetical protein